jgi:hypothetical protein
MTGRNFDIFADVHNDGRMPMNGTLGDDHDSSNSSPLTDEQKMLMGPEVRGYALKEKHWLTFFVTAVSDIPFSHSAFDNLILPNNIKDLILAFTSSKQNPSNAFDDTIQGKGKGIIFLLCGLFILSSHMCKLLTNIFSCQAHLASARPSPPNRWLNAWKYLST